MIEEPLNPFQGHLTNAEWREIVTLEYVLTWNYSDDLKADDERYRELTKKKHGYDVYRKG